MPLPRGNQIVVKLQSIVGSENVITDSRAIKDAQSCTYKVEQSILGIVKPCSTEQVQQIIEIAKESKIPIYTYSTGKNWGYGSRTPQTSNSLLIELSRMNKILDYDETLGCVTVEPGVTQKQLYDFLEEQDSPFGLSVTGSAPDTSIIGNICERGVGIGPYSFRSHYVSNLEVILASGKCIHTGFGRFANAKAAGAYPEGIGPSFYDVFLQSNYGVITKLTMFLVPTPTYAQHIDVSIAEAAELSKYLDILHEFNFYSNARKFITFRNDLRILARDAQYPWSLASNKTPLPTDLRERLKREHGINFAWKAFIAIYGYTRQEVSAQIDYFRSLAKNIDGVSISPLYSQNTLGARPRNLGDGLYWRMRIKPPEVKSPDTDGCGLIRLSMAVPFTGEDITRVTAIMAKVITQFKYEPFIEGHCISERMAIIIAPIIFDRTVPGEDANALACHDVLLQQLMEAGYYPYRDNGRAMTLSPRSSDDYDDLQRIIKDAVDPDNILSPGRYEGGVFDQTR
jgi:4-cresol dehydrogenase (hydroxylating)